MSPYIYNILPNLLDMGLKESEFWEMTLAEITRFADSYARRERNRLKEKAQFDYILADLIGLSVARTQSKKNKMPDIRDVYTFMETPEEKAKRQDNESRVNFLNFANSFNKRFKKQEVQ